MLNKLIFFLLFVNSISNGVSQSSSFIQIDQITVDSLRTIINDPTTADSIKVSLLVDMDYLVMDFDGPWSLDVNKEIDSICINNLRNFNGSEKDVYFFKKLMYAYSTYGILYDDFGQLDLSIDYNLKTLEMSKFLNDSAAIARSYNQLGNLYDEIEDFEKAHEYYFKCFELGKAINDTICMFMSYGNLANSYKLMDSNSLAEEYYLKGLELEFAIDHSYGIGISYNQLGGLYKKMGDYELANKYYDKSIAIKKANNNLIGIASTLINKASLLNKQKKHSLAIESAQEALQIALDFRSINLQSNAYNNLYFGYKGLGNSEKALENYENYIDMRDSLINFENQESVIKKGLLFEHKTQKLKDSLTHVNEQKLVRIEHDREIEKEKQTQHLLFAGLGVVFLFGLFAYNRFKETRRQKIVIEEQKHKVDEAFEQLEEAHQEITDSIAYAKRIQSAILPPRKLVQELLPNSFVLYKPKDVVAGDFYWMEKVGNTTLFAAADCTGHGVPGAMVSVVCNNALNRAVREFGLVDPAQILDTVREIVIQEFEKSEEEVKDGMDIALCALKGNSLQYAGAHNPLWIVRNNEMIEIKADKQPIGKFEKASPFTSHKIDLQKGDSIYVFSDGYVDQFGGEKGKKFKPKALRELLLGIQNHPLNEQSNILDKAIENWRGELEQVDDICFIGVKIDEPTSI